MISIRPASPEALAAIARIRISFTVDRVYDVADDLRLTPRMVQPWVKDYDAVMPPSAWAQRFDTSDWVIISTDDASLVLAVNSPDLMDDAESALIWELRVQPGSRSQGLGRALCEQAARWALNKGFTALVVETQNINAAACDFYAAIGFTLSFADAHAYPELQDEIQLIWRTALTAV